MATTPIIELFIDDEFEMAGIDAISLVSHPAHEENWLAFKSAQQFDVEEYSPYYIVEDNFCDINPALDELGEPYDDLINDGWEIVRVEKITPQMVEKMNKERFSAPNDVSELDADTRIRFKYVGPQDEKNRKFCADMMRKNRVYRIEDIDELTASVANEQFGYYSIFLWRGNFNCRHQWVRLIYKKQGRILNNANSTKNLIDEEGLGALQPDTRTQTTIESAIRGTRADGSPSKQWRPGQPRQGFADLTEACWPGFEAIGTKIGEDGREVPNCVPIEQSAENFAETISDYPQGVKDAAKRVLNYVEKNGWGSCGTNVGKTRANQLAKGEPISIDTIKRMYSYLSRHKKDLETSKSYDDGCGKLMYDSWGSEAALKWAERKLKQIDREKMTFSYDSDHRILIGAAMVPNRMIIRYDELGNPYYVYFSKESIKRMADRFLKQKRTDETSIEHNGKKLGSEKVYITESWVSEDPIYDKSHKYGFELPAGTWFVAMKVQDESVWKMIKEKKLNGFSVEGLFAEKSVFSKEDRQINEIIKILKSNE